MTDDWPYSAGPLCRKAAVAAVAAIVVHTYGDTSLVYGLGLVGDTVSPSGSRFGFVSERCEVEDACGVECFLRAADGEPGEQDGVFVAVADG
jgi:hypothetical protein